MADEITNESSEPTPAEVGGAVADASGPEAVEEQAEAWAPDQAVESGPTPYDFRSPSLISVPEMRALKLMHQEFAKSLATRLAIYLRMEFEVEVTDLRTVACKDWIKGLANPSHLTSFGIETLNGTGLAQMSPVLAMTIVDRLLVGAGVPVTLSRNLSEIEVVLVDEVVTLILKEWCPQMPLDTSAKPMIIGHETNPKFIQPAPGDAQMLAFSVRLRVGDLSESVAIGLPFQMLELMIQRLAPVRQVKREEPVVKRRAPLVWNPELSQVKVQLTAEWGEFDIPAGRLARLQVGDTLEMDTNCVQNVHVCLARVRKFLGQLGARGKTRAVKLTSITKS